jgi:hypothetical protein
MRMDPLRFDEAIERIHFWELKVTQKELWNLNFCHCVYKSRLLIPA